MKDIQQVPNIDKSTLTEVEKWLKHSVNRRDFLRGGAIAAGLALGIFSGCAETVKPAPLVPIDLPPSKKTLPLVNFGNTGIKVPILGLGSQTMGENQDNIAADTLEKRAIEVYQHAINNGVTYIDTASGYGRAEEFIGKAIIDFKRSDLFITTKLWTNSYNDAKENFERSLRRLGTDYVDLLYIHDATQRNIDEVLKQPGDEGYDPSRHGAWTFLEEMKAQGKAKLLGITAHGGGQKVKQLVEHTHDSTNQREKVDAIMVRMSYVSHQWGNFHNIMPPLVEKYDLGAMIMKVYGGPSGFGKNLNTQELQQAVRYAQGYEWAQGCVIGASTESHIDNNIEWSMLPPMSATEMEKMRSLVATTQHIWERDFADYVGRKYTYFG